MLSKHWIWVVGGVGLLATGILAATLARLGHTASHRFDFLGQAVYRKVDLTEVRDCLLASQVVTLPGDSFSTARHLGSRIAMMNQASESSDLTMSNADLSERFEMLEVSLEANPRPGNAPYTVVTVTRTFPANLRGRLEAWWYLHLMK